MKHLTRIVLAVLAGALIGRAPLLAVAETLEELYQKALMAEKGQVQLDKAISLYQRVIDQGGAESKQKALAARAHLRLGLCQEKLGLEQARRTYIGITEKYADQPGTVVAAAKQVQSLQRRRQELERQSIKMNLVPPGQEWEGGEDYANAISVFGQKIAAMSLADLAKSQEDLARAHAELVEAEKGIANFPHMIGVFGSQSHDGSPRFEAYSYTPPQIPYPHTSVAEVPNKWKFMVDLSHDAIHAHKEYTEAKFDDSAWPQINIGQAWEDQGYASYNSGGWYRSQIELDADPKKPVYIAFGGVDEHGYVFVNGKQVGEHHVWDRPFILDISDAVKHKGKNTVVVYVHDTFGMGGIYGLINIHQPEEKNQALPYIANRGGSLAGMTRSDDYAFKFKAPVAVNVQFHQHNPYQHIHIPYPHKSVAEIPNQWRFNLELGADRHHYNSEFAKVDYDDSRWAKINIGLAWEKQGYPDYDQGAWYRTEVKVDADPKKPVYMAFSGVDNDAWIYVNGKLVGEHHVWNRSFTLDISKAVKHKGKNTIAVRVYDGTGLGGIRGKVSIHQPAKAGQGG